MHWPIWRVAVAERSMEPALAPGDWLLVWRGLRRTRPVRIKPGQLVVARHPARSDTLVVKRVAWREPEGWWLNSDNPKAGTADSFRFGAVSPELIEGRVLGRFFPLRRGG
jgi:nickel-type superoxide dismutase maturation protease